MRTSSRFTRTILTAVAVVGFYLIALAFALGLLLLGLSPFLFGWNVSGIFILWSLIGGVVVLWSVLPRWDKFEPPGPLLDPTGHPQLFQKLREVANATDQKMPREVYLINAVNAAVMERGGVFGMGSRRVMLLGLPALRILSISELQAVLAHEFGHFFGGDTRLSSWVYKTRSAIGRTLENLPRRNQLALLWLFFDWYGRRLMSLTLWVSRQQEHSADELAARIYGAMPIASALCKINGSEPIYDAYWTNEMIPAVRQGFVPPWSEGFGRFVGTTGMRKAFSEILNLVMQEEKPGELDTHPVLRDRLAALGQNQDLPISFEETPSTSLLDDLRDLEVQLAAASQLVPTRNNLKQIGWEDVGTRVYAPMWRGRRDRFPDVWASMRIYTLVEDVSSADLANLGKKFLPSGELPPPRELAGRGTGAVGATLTLALIDQGWNLHMLPEASPKLAKDQKCLEPFSLVTQIAQGAITAEAWRQQCVELGIADASLMPSDPN